MALLDLDKCFTFLRAGSQERETSANPRAPRAKEKEVKKEEDRWGCSMPNCEWSYTGLSFRALREFGKHNRTAHGNGQIGNTRAHIERI